MAEHQPVYDTCDICGDEIDIMGCNNGLEWCSTCGRMVCTPCMNIDTNRCKKCESESPKTPVL